ncbi:hypothetical protein L2E82_29673 [Cichorium intybus]|uniref:Uncharacterized protein n=1 Tax=Cichorium intybus TaxID=13427 RepID=A0ACB9CYL1_CICIN|nr:hypothetical protein L2E82_29673 [Cichorium intybus]
MDFEGMDGKDFENGWTFAGARRRRRAVSDKVDDFSSVEGMATTFFVTNLPPGWKAADLWKSFQRFGRLVDAAQEDGDWSPPSLTEELSDSESDEDDLGDGNWSDDWLDNEEFADKEQSEFEDSLQGAGGMSGDRCNDPFPAPDSVEGYLSKIGQDADNIGGNEVVEDTEGNEDSASRVDGTEINCHVSCDEGADAVLQQNEGFEGANGPCVNSRLSLGVNSPSCAGPNASFVNSIPDLNVGIGPIADISSASLLSDGRASSKGDFSRRRKSSTLRKFPHSIRFKDMVLTSQGRNLKSKLLDTRGKSKSGEVNEGSISINSTDKEVENTVELGEKLGYCLKDSRSALKIIIEGEGDAEVAQ